MQGRVERMRGRALECFCLFDILRTMISPRLSGLSPTEVRTCFLRDGWYGMRRHGRDGWRGGAAMSVTNLLSGRLYPCTVIT